jgi:hypothetical protein
MLEQPEGAVVPTDALYDGEPPRLPVGRERVLLFIGTQFSSLYTAVPAAVDTPGSG